jgi:hypothetical protein
MRDQKNLENQKCRVLAISLHERPLLQPLQLTAPCHREEGALDEFRIKVQSMQLRHQPLRHNSRTKGYTALHRFLNSLHGGGLGLG